jgi:hypothetical protein
MQPSDNLVREQVISIFEHAIHVVFYVLVAFAGLGLLLVLLENKVPMRTENNTEFGIEERNDGQHEGRVDNGDGEVAA